MPAHKVHFETPEERKERLRIYAREYQKNRRANDPEFLERCRKFGRESRNRNSTERNIASSEWRSKNKEAISVYNKQYQRLNFECIKQKRFEYLSANVDKIKETSKIYKSENAEKTKVYNREYSSRRYKEDSVFRLKMAMRNRIRLALKGKIKFASLEKMLGCSYDEFKKYIELQFKNNMSWENMGKWHIDHIRPLASFDLMVKQEQEKAFHYTNHQPLWAVENLMKGAKYAG